MALQFKVGEVPRTKPFQFADLAELILLAGIYSEISKAHLDQLIASGSMDSDPNDTPLDSGISMDDKYSSNAEDCFRQLRYRAGALDDDYPFLVIDSVLQPREKITNAGYVYLFLLVSSRLASFHGKSGFVQDAAKTFTKLAKFILSKILKQSATVYVFDANSDDRKVIFGTNLRTALKILASKLSALPLDQIIDQQHTSGDGGLDLVAITNLDDSARGSIAYFGQCAAQQDGWPSKTLEPKKSHAFFSFGHPPYNLMLTPVMFRTGTGAWVNDMQTQDCVLIDRLRIMRALREDFTSCPADVWFSVKETVDAIPQTASQR